MLNKGIAFGIFPNLPGWIFVLVLLVLIFYAGLPAVPKAPARRSYRSAIAGRQLLQAGKMRELWGRVGVGLIVIGGVGNLVSRAIFGGVVDNWNFLGLLYNNGWDYLIFFGLVIYGYSYYFRR